MSRTVILGGSAAAIKIIEEIRRNDTAREILLISFDGLYPYRRDLFAPYLEKTLSSKELFCVNKEFYEQNKVRVILDQKISRINLNRRRIIFESKEHVEFDVLVITDTPENRFPPIKGTNKTGVFGGKKLNDIDQMNNMIPLIDTVAIQSDTVAGLSMAFAVAKRGKEVILVTSSNSFLLRHLNEETRSALISQWRGQGISVLLNGTITELLGDKEVKAIKLNSGKVFSAEMVLFMETNEDLRLWAGTGLALDKEILINPEFKTNIDYVYALDLVGQCPSDAMVAYPGSRYGQEPVVRFEDLNRQGKAVAFSLLGQDQETIWGGVYTLDLVDSFTDICFIGQTELAPDVEFQQEWESEKPVFKRIYHKNQVMLGVVLINAAHEKADWVRRIQNQELIEVPVLKQESTTADGSSLAQSEEQEKVSTEVIDN